MAAMQPASQRLRAAEDIPEDADVNEAAPTPIQPRAAKWLGPMGYDDFPAMVHATDPEGWLIGVSDHWLAVLGYGRDEVLGRHCTEFLTEESRHHALETVIPTVMRTDLCRDVECQFRKKDGSVIWILASLTGGARPRGGNPAHSGRAHRCHGIGDGSEPARSERATPAAIPLDGLRLAVGDGCRASVLLRFRGA